MSSRKKNHTIHSETQQIIANVIQFFDEEKSSGKFKYPVNNATKRAAAATGKAESTICCIRKEMNLAQISGKN